MSMLGGDGTENVFYDHKFWKLRICCMGSGALCCGWLGLEVLRYELEYAVRFWVGLWRDAECGWDEGPLFVNRQVICSGRPGGGAIRIDREFKSVSVWHHVTL